MPSEPVLSSATSDSGTASASSYGEILRTSVLIGGSSVLNVVIRVARIKALAVMLGPAGIGLLGILSAIEDLASSIAGMGLRMSGVRQIADAASRKDEAAVAVTVTVLRRISRWLAVAGCISVIAFCRPISTFSFGTDRYMLPVALIGLAVFFRVITDGHGAVIHGLRRIEDLARLGPIGALLGALVGVGIVYLLGEQGIAPANVAAAALALGVTWWFRKRIKVATPVLTNPQVREEAVRLLRLGAAFMASGMLILGATYGARIIVLQHEGFEAAGLYQAAVAVGSLYVTIVLQAMSSDFYPRLVGAASDDAQCNRLVNEQAHISLLLAGPGITATLTLAYFLVHLLYSAEFAGAAPALQWICAGMALRVISWPLGMVMLAKNSQKVFFWSELAWNSLSVGLTWFAVSRMGLVGAGYAFAGTQVFHALMTYSIVRHLSGFRWSPLNRALGTRFLLSVVAVLVAFLTLPQGPAVVFGLLVTFLSGIYSLLGLVRVVSPGRLPPVVRRVVSCFESF